MPVSILLAVVLAWALVAVSPLLVRVSGRSAGWPLAGGLLGVLGVVVAVRLGEGDVWEAVSWVPAIDVALRLRLNGISFLFALVVLVIGAIVLVYSSSYLRAARSTGFYVLMTAFAASMLTLILADDLVVLFVAWELTTLCSYLLILRSGPAAREPATRTLLVTAAGGLCLLGAVVVIIVRTGTSDLSVALGHQAWGEDSTFATVVAVLVAVAAMTKSAQFPFHAWLPDAMVAPAPVSAYLHAAAMVKAGIFLLMVFAPATSQAAVWPVLLVTVGLVTAVMGAFFAVRRRDLKELLAYSTVSQLGLLVAVIGLGTPEAMLAASLHVVAHALFKSSAFMGVGLIERRAGTRDLRELRGLRRAMPWDAAMLVLAASSMAGIAPLLGFVSKELVFEAFLTSPGGALISWTLVVVVTAGAMLTVAYSARIVLPTLPGTSAQVLPWRASAGMSVAVSVTALAGLLLGLIVPVLDDVVRPAAADAAGVDVGEVYGLALWHGVNASLLLSLAAILAGLVVAVAYGRARGSSPERAAYISGVAVVQGAQDGIIAFGRRVGDLTRFDSPAANLTTPIVLVGLGAFALPGLWRGWPEHASSFSPLDALLLVVIVAGILAVARAGAQLTAVIAVGVVGFAVVLWFFVLGASDVALTQLLVEILTVVVMILVLRRLPRRFATADRRRRLLAGVAALAAGVVATVAALVFTGHRPLSGVGEFFLKEAEELTGGTNVVNTILVDFRALDTLGELVVLGVSAVALTALLEARRLVERAVPQAASRALADPRANAVFLGTLERALVPVMLLASAYALLRGHNAPGGGFIAALVGAAAIILSYLSAATDEVPRVERPYLPIAGAGIIVAVGSGLLGLVEGSFLRPLHFDVLDLHLTTALVFDLGVYLAVLGVILAAVNRLALSPTDGPGVGSVLKRWRRPRTGEQGADAR